MIPNHIKIGNAEKFISQYISEHSFSKIGFLVDSNSADHCLKQIEQKFSFDFHVITISDGEENKNLSTCEKVWQELINQKFDRNSLLINYSLPIVIISLVFISFIIFQGNSVSIGVSRMSNHNPCSLFFLSALMSSSIS